PPADREWADQLQTVRPARQFGRPHQRRVRRVDERPEAGAARHDQAHHHRARQRGAAALAGVQPDLPHRWNPTVRRPVASAEGGGICAVGTASGAGLVHDEMMDRFRALRRRAWSSWGSVVVVASSLWLLAAPGAMAQASVDSASLRWEVPTLLPPGARLAVVS